MQAFLIARIALAAISLLQAAQAQAQKSDEQEPSANYSRKATASIAGVDNFITKPSSATPAYEFGFRPSWQKPENYWFQHGDKIAKFCVIFFANLVLADCIAKTVQANAATKNDLIFRTETTRALGSPNNLSNALDVGLDSSYKNFRVTLNEKMRSDIRTGRGLSNSNYPTGKYVTNNFSVNLAWNDKNFAEDLTSCALVNNKNKEARTASDGIILIDQKFAQYGCERT